MMFGRTIRRKAVSSEAPSERRLLHVGVELEAPAAPSDDERQGDDSSAMKIAHLVNARWMPMASWGCTARAGRGRRRSSARERRSMTLFTIDRPGSGRERAPTR